MLRHFKMEILKRQQEEEMANQSLSNENNLSSSACATMPTALKFNQLAPNDNRDNVCNVQQTAIFKQKTIMNNNNNKTTRVKQSKVANASAANAASNGADSELVAPTSVSRSARSRRASKPQMEKRRRARINECLDILKSYVLTDSSNLSHLGIDPAASENQDEETIARIILKSSGLIHRHRGRKNPNKLEKADILELTVDYVRRLHEQRNELLLFSSCTGANIERDTNNNIDYSVMNLKKVPSVNENYAHNNNGGGRCANNSNLHLDMMFDIPAHLSEPLTLDLSPKSRILQQNTHALNFNNNTNDDLLVVHNQPYGAPLTPPPSSASSIQSSCAAAAASASDNSTTSFSATNNQQLIVSRILQDNYKFYENQQPTYMQQLRC